MQYPHIVVIIPLTMRHRNIYIYFNSTILKKNQAIVCLRSCCNRPSSIVCALQSYYYYTCTINLETIQIQIPMLPKDHHQQKMVKTYPPTHFFSNLPLHFENTHHLSLRFLHPLGFLNFDCLNHFRYAYNT